MKEAKNDGVLADFPLSAPKELSQPTPDLSALADRLLSIASELRKGQKEGAFERTTPLDRGRFGEGRPSSPEPSPPAAHRHMTGTHAIQTHPAGGEKSISQPMMEEDHRRLIFAQEARTTYAKRRERTAIFGQTELFGEPAWDILLDLYIAHAENKQVSVSSACIGSAAPPTTGLRWLGVLAENGLIVREHDPEDQRRVLVRLSERGISAMDTYFEKTLTDA